MKTNPKIPKRILEQTKKKRKLNQAVMMNQMPLSLKKIFKRLNSSLVTKIRRLRL